MAINILCERVLFKPSFSSMSKQVLTHLFFMLFLCGKVHRDHRVVTTLAYHAQTPDHCINTRTQEARSAGRDTIQCLSCCYMLSSTRQSAQRNSPITNLQQPLKTTESQNVR